MKTKTVCHLCLFLHKIFCEMVWKFCEILWELLSRWANFCEILSHSVRHGMYPVYVSEKWRPWSDCIDCIYVWTVGTSQQSINTLGKYCEISCSFCMFWDDNTTQNVSFPLLLGLVVQSVVSLTSSLRVISLTVLADSIYNILIFLLKKCE